MEQTTSECLTHEDEVSMVAWFCGLFKLDLLIFHLSFQLEWIILAKNIAYCSFKCFHDNLNHWRGQIILWRALEVTIGAELISVMLRHVRCLHTRVRVSARDK